MAALVLELPPDFRDRLESAAAQNGMNTQDYAVLLLTTALHAGVPPITGADVASPPVGEAKPYWQVGADLMQDVPEEELARLPADLSENLDHYLYGQPRKQNEGNLR